MSKKQRIYKKNIKKQIKNKKVALAKLFKGRGRHKKIKKYISEQYKEALEWDTFIDNSKAG